jgi:uncharacterized protein YodC (DUF2158 family)
MPKIKVGDIVRLKSGGPKMTVERILWYKDGDGQILCTWYNSLWAKIESNTFYLSSLVLAE